MATPEETVLTPDKQETQVDVEAPRPTQDKPNVSVSEKLKKPTVRCGLGTFAVLNLIMFIVGCTTTMDCPIKPIIPVYLIAAGAIGIVSKLLPFAKLYKDSVLLDVAITIIYLVELILLILGSYWVFSIYTPNYRRGPVPHCNKIAYLLAFWLISLQYIFLIICFLVPLSIGCCILCYTAYIKAKK